MMELSLPLTVAVVNISFWVEFLTTDRFFEWRRILLLLIATGKYSFLQLVWFSSKKQCHSQSYFTHGLLRSPEWSIQWWTPVAVVLFSFCSCMQLIHLSTWHPCHVQADNLRAGVDATLVCELLVMWWDFNFDILIRSQCHEFTFLCTSIETMPHFFHLSTVQHPTIDM